MKLEDLTPNDREMVEEFAAFLRGELGMCAACTAITEAPCQVCGHERVVYGPPAAPGDDLWTEHPRFE